MSAAGWAQLVAFGLLLALSTRVLGAYMYRVYFTKHAPGDRFVEILARNPGKLITQRHLLEHVWGLTDTKTNYVRVFMVAIRKKLEPDPAHPRYFLTEPGSGLRFVPEGVAPSAPGRDEIAAPDPAD